jgi:hypothetical protein
MLPSNPARSLATLALSVAVACALTACSSSGSAPQSHVALPPAQSPAASPSPAASGSAAQATATDSEGGAIGKPVVPSGTTKPQVGKIARPSDAKAIEEAKRLLHANEDAEVVSASVTAMTQDGHGRWWVLLAVKDAQSGDVQAVLLYDGKRWSDAVYAEKVQTTDLPPDVVF